MIWWSSSCFNSYERKLIMHLQDKYLWFEIENLSNCRFNPDDPADKYCPIFVLKDIVSGTGSRYDELSGQGGVIQIRIKWNCNLDLSVDKCLPEYSFKRLDSSTYKISKGYNFRYSRNFKDANGTEFRTLYKAYGIKFVISVSGQARKFAPVPFFTNVGSGLALLSIATVICDIVVLYMLKARALYKEKKYLQVVGDDAYKVLDWKIHSWQFWRVFAMGRYAADRLCPFWSLGSIEMYAWWEVFIYFKKMTHFLVSPYVFLYIYFCTFFFNLLIWLVDL